MKGNPIIVSLYEKKGKKLEKANFVPDIFWSFEIFLKRSILDFLFSPIRLQACLDRQCSTRTRKFVLSQEPFFENKKRQKSL